MSDVSMNVDQVLAQMRVLAAKAQGVERTPDVPPTQGVEFSQVMSNSINAVNDAQKLSGDLKKRFEMGDQSVSMVDIAVASEKAKIAFTAMTEVRSKLVDAYKAVMSMPI